MKTIVNIERKITFLSFFVFLMILVDYAMQTHFGKCGKSPNKYGVRDACVVLHVITTRNFK